MCFHRTSLSVRAVLVPRVVVFFLLGFRFVFVLAALALWLWCAFTFMTAYSIYRIAEYLSAASAFLLMFFAYFNIYYGLCFWYLTKMNYCQLLLCILCALIYAVITIMKCIVHPEHAEWVQVEPMIEHRGYAEYCSGQIVGKIASSRLMRFPRTSTTATTHFTFTIPFVNLVWNRKKEIKNIQSTCAAPGR